jgi:hypothetical protein
MGRGFFPFVLSAGGASGCVTGGAVPPDTGGREGTRATGRALAGGAATGAALGSGELALGVALGAVGASVLTGVGRASAGTVAELAGRARAT